MPLMEKELSSGKKVSIAFTDEEWPPTHGKAFQKKWNPESGRESLSFYDSTVDYMRNEWTAVSDNIRSTEINFDDEVESQSDDEIESDDEVEFDDKPLLLFFDERTRTWHSSEALDVDHRTPWHEHFDNLEVWSREDAMLAYNDAGNLRVVSATYNRARDSADAILDDPTKGVHSPEWKDWVDRRMRFDVGADYPAYDRDEHGVNRSSRTTEAVWTAGVTRKGLAFDGPIKTTWLDHALKKAYAGEVLVPDPDHPDDRTKDHAVQLFRCAVTEQLVTRGGLDIDHKIPFTVRLKEKLDARETLCRQAEVDGDDPPPPISKADVLDLYNDPENLRLMSRSANSGHEWEVGLDGEYYDPELDGAEYATPEPTVIVVDDHEPVVYADEEAVNPRKRGRDDVDPPLNVHVDDDDPSELATKIVKRDDDDGADVGVSWRDATLRAMHPEDFGLFEKIRGEVAKLDPAQTGPLSPAQQDNLSMMLVYGARDQKIHIDHVCCWKSKDSKDKDSKEPLKLLGGIQGPLHEDTGKTWFPMDAFKNVPLEVTAGHVAEQRQQAAQAVAPVQPQHTPAQHM